VRRVRVLVVGVVLLVAAGAVLALVGNGSHQRSSGRTKQTPAARPFEKQQSVEIARQAIAAMAKVRNFRAEVTVQERHAVLQIDVRRGNGGECFGQVTERGQTMTMIATKDYTYVRASAHYWREFGNHVVVTAMAPQPSKWARFADTEAHDLCDVPGLLKKLDLDKKTLAGLLAKEPAPFQGYTAVVLANPDDSINIVVNRDSPHYILDIRDEGEVQFSEFGLPAPVSIPRRGQYVPFLDSSITV
jgi:hypothetical protein